MKLLLAFLCSFWLVLPVMGQSAAEKVAQTEAAFAAKAKASTLKEAFLEYLDDSARILNQGKWVYGKQYWKTQKAVFKDFQWSAELASASDSGDLAFTTGPWFVQQNGKVTAQGHFNTIWKLRKDGTYRVILDLGIDYPVSKVKMPLEAGRLVIPTSPTNISLTEILNMDEDFSTRIRSRSPQVAYLEAMSEEGRLLRPDHTPLVDKSWIATYLRKEPKSIFEPKGGYVAESGDIAYVYGEVENKAHLGVYMRVWRHEARDGWKLALEVIQYSADK